MKGALYIISLTAVCLNVDATADDRIRSVAYSPGEVVRINTALGIPTLIQFAQDETVLDGKIGMIGIGDAKAWSIGPRGSNIMIKPQAEKPDTAMLVVTNKRTYAFELRSVDRKSGMTPTMVVRFTYPAKEIAPSAKTQPKNEQPQVAPPPRQRNRMYSKQGDSQISPSAVEDDGRFTFMTFKNAESLPVIFKVMADGTEAITNTHIDTENGTVVIHETAAKFILRYGKTVMAIRNDNFKPGETFNRERTTIPGVSRIGRDQK
jgi:type IV secretion system protein VirB9